MAAELFHPLGTPGRPAPPKQLSTELQGSRAVFPSHLALRVFCLVWLTPIHERWPAANWDGNISLESCSFMWHSWCDTETSSVKLSSVQSPPGFPQPRPGTPVGAGLPGDGLYVPMSSLLRTSKAMFLRAVATDDTTLSLSMRSSSTRMGSPFSFLTAARM